MFTENIRLRLRHILWPFLRLLLVGNSVIAVISIVILHYNPLIKLSDNVETFVGIIALAFSFVALLKESFLLVRDESTRKNGATLLLFMVAFVTFGFAVGTIPCYMITKLGHLQLLPTLANLPSYPDVPYYRANRVVLDTTNKKSYPYTFEGGKSSYRAFNLAVACPVASAIRPALASGTSAVWVLFNYYNRSDAPGIRDTYWDAYQKFISNKKLEFRRAFQRPCYYFERLPDDEWLGQPENKTRIGIRPPQGSELAPIILRPVYAAFSERTATITPLLVWSQVIGASLFCMLSLILPLDEVRKQQLLTAESSLIS